MHSLLISTVNLCANYINALWWIVRFTHLLLFMTTKDFTDCCTITGFVSLFSPVRWFWINAQCPLSWLCHTLNIYRSYLAGKYKPLFSPNSFYVISQGCRVLLALPALQLIRVNGCHNLSLHVIFHLRTECWRRTVAGNQAPCADVLCLNSCCVLPV